MARVDLNQQANVREQVLFGLSLVVLLFLFFKMVYPPIAQKKATIKEKYNALVTDKRTLENFLAMTPTLQQTDSLSRKKGIKMKILYGEIKSVYNDLNSLLTQITDRNFLRGLEVDKIDYQPAVNENGYSYFDFNVALHGGFVPLLRCLDRLDQFPALFNLEKVSFDIDPKNVQDLTANLQGRFYDVGGNP